MSVQQAEQAILIELPRDSLAPIAESPDAFAKEMRLAAAMLWYLQGRVSHERAAKYAGISRIAFIDALAAAKLPAFHVDVDEVMEEVRDARGRFVNTSPLVFLAREDLLEILRSGVDDVAVPEPVIEEIRGHGMGDPTVMALDRVHWLTIVPGPVIPPAIADWRLGPGESAVLALALAEVGSRAVLDDWGARRCARTISIPVIGTLGLVLLAKQEGSIPAARPVIERLRRSGMYLADEVIREALARVGE